MTEPPPIDYANRSLPAPPPSELFYIAIGGWALAAGVGVCTLLAYAVTWRPFFMLAGIAWLLIGGAITIAAFVCGKAYAAKSKACNYVSPHTSRRATLAFYLPASNAILASLCALAGMFLVLLSPAYFTVRLTNATPEAVSASLVFDDGSTTSIGIIGPSETRSKKVKLVTGGRLLLRARQGNREWDQLAMDYVDED